MFYEFTVAAVLRPCSTALLHTLSITLFAQLTQLQLPFPLPAESTLARSWNWCSDFIIFDGRLETTKETS